MDPEAKLRQLGMNLPAPPKPVASYRTAVRSGNLLFIAGTGPMLDGKVEVRGKLGAEVNVPRGYNAARLCALNSLAIAREHLGSLDRVKRAVKATVYVASAPAFYDQPKVADGATDLLRELWGEEGLPARAAVGVASLPLDIAVELELVLEVA
ncbi:MAG TPA: RidA family protein [Candidatus Thermoplasmatota archaeon]|jgi:enamine deaminase RidA (YjgF/YER057c/UK114 family)|nr:RidA family protein [Candidatus Thermoplasmatota archaeon]